MRIILHSSSFYILGAVVLVGVAVILILGTFKSNDKQMVTAVVEHGDVIETVSVSGVVEAQNTAELAFPVTGIVTDVFVNEGQLVEKGDVLATLASSQLVAQRLSAVATLQKATAEKDELLAGPTEEARTVTDQTIYNAEQNLSRVIAAENEKVENANRTLLSSSLEAYSAKEDEDATPPIITGTYTCEAEGEYIFDMFSSGSRLGYSFTLEGLGDGTVSAFADSPGTFGTCGLFAQFSNNSSYGSSEWVVPIPNTRSASYQTNLNVYNLAVQQQANAIDSAEHALELVKEQAVLSNASPRSEAVRKANATILQAQAQINAIDAQIADRSIIAPFSGIITDTSILPGETATALPVITLLASGAFELTARIPEIDVTKIAEYQTADVVFDARRNETISAIVDFISPLATEIDGVAYFNATISFEEIPLWLRGGLNADIDIIVGEATDVLRIPKRFVETTDGVSVVLVLEGASTIPTEIELGFAGNDGYVEIIGLEKGTTVVAP